MDLHEVAELAHVPADVIQAFEEGKGSITSSALERVAYVLSVDPAALKEGRVERRPNATIFFRQGAFPDFRDAEDRPKVAAALELSLALREINAILGRAASLRSKFEPEEPTPEPHKDGYRLAWRVRRELGDEDKPLPDMRAFLEEQFDILVVSEPLSSSRVDALSVKENAGGAAAVLLNAASERRSNPYATRVDLAHELSHVLFDPANGEINLILDEIDEDDEKSGQEKTTRRAEQRARAFAAELLMPQAGLLRAFGTPQYVMPISDALSLVERVRQEFKTPIEITVNHLCNRGYIWHVIREQVIEKAREREGHPVNDQVSRPADTSPLNVLERRVMEALQSDVITLERARELLGLSPWDSIPGVT